MHNATHTRLHKTQCMVYLSNSYFFTDPIKMLNFVNIQMAFHVILYSLKASYFHETSPNDLQIKYKKSKYVSIKISSP